jgi:TolB protein
VKANNTAQKGAYSFLVRSKAFALQLLVLLAVFCQLSPAQEDWIRTGTNLGVQRIRLAVAEFKPAGADAKTAEFLKIFNDTLASDLENAGIFDIVSRSFHPLTMPATPEEMRLDAWSNAPVNAAMVAFGNFGVSGSDVAMMGWLYDVKNPASPQVLGKQYRDPASGQSARTQAHRFANEIIFRLGGGIPGIAESKIQFVSDRNGNKEIWEMDYDGANQRALANLKTISLSPKASPDGSRVLFSAFARHGLELHMYSRELGRMVSFPRFGGTNISPAWSPDGMKIAFSSSMRGDSDIYVVDASGANPRRLTAVKGPESSPVWNPKTGAQIAFVSGRSGVAQIYIMDAEGANVQRLTDIGYAVSPSWSPNGQFLAFAWMRKYGPGAPGAQDIYIMDIANRKWVQLTHDAGRNDFPSWSPDGRHIVFQSNRSGRDQIWTMLADGTRQQPLTSSGKNTQPNWSFK